MAIAGIVKDVPDIAGIMVSGSRLRPSRSGSSLMSHAEAAGMFVPVIPTRSMCAGVTESTAPMTGGATRSSLITARAASVVRLIIEAELKL